MAPPVVKEADRNVKAEYKNDDYDSFKLESKEALLRPGESPVMRVFPPVVEFHGVEVERYMSLQSPSKILAILYESTFYTTKNTCITLRNEPKGGLAPGLDLSADIEFLLKRNKISDKLTVVSGKYRLEIPLHAFAPAPGIGFDGLLLVFV